MRESVCGNMIHCDTLLECNTMHYKNSVYLPSSSLNIPFA